MAMAEIGPQPLLAANRSDDRQHIRHAGARARPGFLLDPIAERQELVGGCFRSFELAIDRRLARPGQAPVYRQLERAEASANELLSLGNRVEQEPWSGTRPCMPDMLPVIGPVGGQKGLWANFGHGHQGFTLGPASAELLTAMILGEKPPVDPAPFRPGR